MDNTSQSGERKYRVGKNKKLKNKLKFGIKLQIVFCIFVILITVCMIIFALCTKFSTNVISNLYFEDIDISGKSENEVKNLICEFENKIYDRSIIIFQDNKILFEINYEDLGIEINSQDTLKEILSYAKTGSLLQDNISILKTLFDKKVFDIKITYDNSKVAYTINNIMQSIENKVVNDSYVVMDDKLIITKGTTGLGVDKDELLSDLTNIILGRENSSESMVQEYHLKLYEKDPVPLDVDSLYTSVYKEAKNAYIDDTQKPVIMNSHEYGVNFDKEDLRAILSEEENLEQGKIIEYKLTITSPDVLLNDLQWNHYEDLLGTFSTTFATEIEYENRNENIKLAANFINGVIVMPNETFSFNKIVGNSDSTARGFKEATIYTSNGVGIGVGGGICQVSSTLYNAALLSNMEIIERSNHRYSVSYVPCGRDATISYPYLDLKFKNTRNYPIKIVAYYNENGKLSVSIYGTKENDEYNIYIESYVLTRISKDTTYIKDDTLNLNDEVIDILGQDGFTSIAYRIYKKDDDIIKKEVLSSDTYLPINKVVRYGKKYNSINIYGE